MKESGFNKISQSYEQDCRHYYTLGLRGGHLLGIRSSGAYDLKPLASTP
jgi:hypothetical protein